MSKYEKYRSREIIEAKQMDHPFGLLNPRTGERQDGKQGDYLIKRGNTPESIMPRELFNREYERIEQS